MTKRTFFFFGIWVGIMLGAWVALVGNNERWKLDAWNHHAAAWDFRATDESIRWSWHWIDEEDGVRHYSTPTPAPFVAERL